MLGFCESAQVVVYLQHIDLAMPEADFTEGLGQRLLRSQIAS
jgi:hypothetical protein